MEFRGGKPSGTLTRRDNSFSVVTCRTFSAEEYGGVEKALDAAVAWQREFSDRFGQTKNEWAKSDGILRVRLTQGKVMDTDDLPDAAALVEKHVFHAVRVSGERWHAVTVVDGRQQTFHALYSKFANCRHISGDGLDNRLANLCDGGPLGPVRKRGASETTASKVAGVSLRPDNSAWRARWTDRTKKPPHVTEHFSIAEHGNATAFQMAVARRHDAEEELIRRRLRAPDTPATESEPI